MFFNLQVAYPASWTARPCAFPCRKKYLLTTTYKVQCHAFPHFQDAVILVPHVLHLSTPIGIWLLDVTAGTGVWTCCSCLAG